MSPVRVALGAIALTVTLACGCATREKPALVVECGQPPRSPPAAGPALVGEEYGVTITPIPLDAVVFNDKKLARKVAVQALWAQRTPADTVEVGARLVNCTTNPLQLGVRTSFMDSRQRPTEQISGWKAVFIQPRTTALYSEVSIDRDSVSHYLVEVRDATR